MSILKIKNEQGQWVELPVIKGTDGKDGADGKSGVYIGTEAPTDEDMDVWIDSDGTADDIVTDVQINGSSIVSDGIANVPTAASNRLGVVKADVNAGIGSSNGTLIIIPAINAEILKGASKVKPIVPYVQHLATFYGLAKAAGDTTQSQGGNVMGQYTDTAKGKIHDMLGIGVAKELRAYSELGEDVDLIEIPLPDRYEKVWFRFMCRINNAENNLANASTQMLAWIGDSTSFAPLQDPSIYENVYIRQTDIFMIKGWFVVDFPFVERFATGAYGATNWSAKSNIASFDGAYSVDRLTSYPHSLFIRPYDISKGYLFKANSKLGVYVK